MQIKYKNPTFEESAFNCPHCQAYSNQQWTWHLNGIKDPYGLNHETNESFYFARCSNCKKYSIWLHKEMIYPLMTIVEPINQDAPEDVKKDYEEASKVLHYSPRSSNALLRLALQKLCIHLGAKADSLDHMIGELVAKKGLSPKIQSAMDAIRVIGNDSVHPGEIQDSDTIETAAALFKMINIIIDTMITDEKMIKNVIANIPQSQKDHILKRNQKAKSKS